MKAPKSDQPEFCKRLKRKDIQHLRKVSNIIQQTLEVHSFVENILQEVSTLSSVQITTALEVKEHWDRQTKELSESLGGMEISYDRKTHGLFSKAIAEERRLLFASKYINFQNEELLTDEGLFFVLGKLRVFEKKQVLPFSLRNLS